MTAAARIPTDDLDTAARDLEGADAEAVLAWTFERFPRVAVVASFQAESVVLIDMASRLRPGVDVITLDTGRLPQETHDLIDTVRDRFPVTLNVVSPDPTELAEMARAHGVNLFYLSPELRHTCCDVRKTRPLARALAGYGAWVTGLRREQSATRRATPVVSRDDGHGGIVKVAPLVGWSREDVWARARARGLPSHALYASGYTSIGCAPCTRATRPGEDERAGRWWWEGDSIKECGLHPVLTGPGAAADVATSPGRADAGAESTAVTAAPRGAEG
jgi:thioredoxin-dependent adenylylsulfate APS reductase